MNYKIIINLIVFSSFFTSFATEDEREKVLDKMAKFHCDHNLKFNNEYSKKKEIDKLDDSGASPPLNSDHLIGFIDFLQLEALGKK